MTLFERVCSIKYMGSTERFHTEEFLGGKETILHHSASTALILIQLLPESDCSLALIKAALMHDLEEGVTGDIPAPTKRALGGIRFEKLERSIREHYGIRFPELTDNERTLLHAADVLDATLTCLTQRKLGNTFINNVFGFYCHYMYESHLMDCNPVFAEMWREVVEAYNREGFTAPRNLFWQSKAASAI